jgi:hypothetical protein
LRPPSDTSAPSIHSGSVAALKTLSRVGLDAIGSTRARLHGATSAPKPPTDPWRALVTTLSARTGGIGDTQESAPELKLAHQARLAVRALEAGYPAEALTTMLTVALHRYAAASSRRDTLLPALVSAQAELERGEPAKAAHALIAAIEPALLDKPCFDLDGWPMQGSMHLRHAVEAVARLSHDRALRSTDEALWTTLSVALRPTAYTSESTAVFREALAEACTLRRGLAEHTASLVHDAPSLARAYDALIAQAVSADDVPRGQVGPDFAKAQRAVGYGEIAYALSAATRQARALAALGDDAPSLATLQRWTHDHPGLDAVLTLAIPSSTQLASWSPTAPELDVARFILGARGEDAAQTLVSHRPRSTPPPETSVVLVLPGEPTPRIRALLDYLGYRPEPKDGKTTLTLPRESYDALQVLATLVAPPEHDHFHELHDPRGGRGAPTVELRLPLTDVPAAIGRLRAAGVEVPDVVAKTPPKKLADALRTAQAIALRSREPLRFTADTTHLTLLARPSDALRALLPDPPTLAQELRTQPARLAALTQTYGPLLPAALRDFPEVSETVLRAALARSKEHRIPRPEHFLQAIQEALQPATTDDLREARAALIAGSKDAELAGRRLVFTDDVAWLRAVPEADLTSLMSLRAHARTLASLPAELRHDVLRVTTALTNGVATREEVLAIGRSLEPHQDLLYTLLDHDEDHVLFAALTELESHRPMPRLTASQYTRAAERFLEDADLSLPPRNAHPVGSRPSAAAQNEYEAVAAKILGHFTPRARALARSDQLGATLSATQRAGLDLALALAPDPRALGLLESIVLEPGVRAFARKSSGEIHLDPKDSATTTMHEAGHFLEHSVPGLVDAATTFRDKRGTEYALREGRSGVVKAKLSTLAPDHKYDDDEVAVRGNFVSPYVGKVYSDATEVISMGLERFHPDALGTFLAADREHALLILGVLVSHHPGLGRAASS